MMSGCQSSNNNDDEEDEDRVADVEGAQERRSTKGQGLLRKEGPPTYAILSRNLVLSRFTPFLKGFHRAFNESHPAFVDLSTFRDPQHTLFCRKI